MSFRSPLDDFVGSSLAAVPGCWGKLEYVASLRQPDGTYFHWGMRRLHGEAAVQSALEAAHRTLFLEILRTSLRQLLAEAQAAASEQEMDPTAYMSRLKQRSPELLPADCGGGSVRHFSSVLEALSKLARPRRRASLPAA